MDIMERINIMKQCSLVDNEGYQDLLSVVRVFHDDFQFNLTEENGGVMITHLGAAIHRMKSGEKVTPLDSEVLKQAEEEPVYETSIKILNQIRKEMISELPKDEQDFMIVHICNTLECDDSH